MSLSRREFVQCVVGGIAVTFISCSRTDAVGPLSTHWQLELHADGRILMRTIKVEMGQGAHTGLRTLLAEELDVSPESIEIVQAPSDPAYGEIITGGSYSLAGWQERVRRAGATARHMLRQAAARRWNVPIEDIRTQEAELIDAAGGERLAYRDCVATAAQLSLPPAEIVHLKAPEEWRYIGRRRPIAWHTEIVLGKAMYGVDVRLPGMRYAVLARAPVLGAKLASWDDVSARKVQGFIAAIPLRGDAWPTRDHCRDAIAVVATNSWAAQQARAALRVEWDPGASDAINSVSLHAELDAHVDALGTEAEAPHEIDAASPADAHDATYRQPWLAHAPLEPPNATARVLDGHIEVWSGTQRQTRMKEAIGRALQVDPDRVTVHATLIGGSFGRRLEVDYGVEAAKAAYALREPVQVLWTREDDLQFGLYRSGSAHRLSASLDAAGRLHTFSHHYAAQSVLAQQEPDQIGPGGGDWTFAAPLVSLLYAAPNVGFEHRVAQSSTPCAWWRGTYWNNVTTAVECFIDELAERSGQDPLTFRLAHLASNAPREFVVNKDVRVPFDPARMRRVLAAAAERAGWSTPPAAGYARGLACGIYDSPECHAAVIVEVTQLGGALQLARATVAVDVGTAVNPSIVEAQAMGGFVMGASAALHERISWRAGRVEQRGFRDYRVLRMDQCPPIDVVIVESDAGFCGVGEIVTPAAIAAVSNAASRVLGRRVREWPIVR